MLRMSVLHVCSLSLCVIAFQGCGKEAKDEAPAAKNDPKKAGDSKPTDANKSGSSEANIVTCAAGTAVVFDPAKSVLSAKGAFRARILAWQSGPQVTQGDGTRNSFAIEVATACGVKPSQFEVISLSPYMKVHGHGVPRAYLPEWQVLENKVTVTKLGFIMSGPWEINLQANVNGVADNIEIPVEVP
jgi:hypothetical protein